MFEKPKSQSVSSLPPVPNVVKTILATGVEEIIDNYKLVLAEADKTLFQESSYAKSDKDRALYFSAMDECKKKREPMAEAFSTAMHNLLENFGNEEEKEEEKDNLFATRLAEGNLRIDFGMVEDNDLQEKIVVESMVSKANRMFGHLIDLISDGLNQAVTTTEITNKSNPLNPTLVGDCLFESFKPANFDSRSRLIVYRLFDKGLFLKLDKNFLERIKDLEKAGFKIAEKIRNKDEAVEEVSEPPQAPPAPPPQQEVTPQNTAPPQKAAPKPKAVAPTPQPKASAQLQAQPQAPANAQVNPQSQVDYTPLTTAEITAFIENTHIPTSLRTGANTQRVNRQQATSEQSVLTLSNKDIDTILSEIQQAATLLSGTDHLDVLNALGDQLEARSTDSSIQAVGQVSENVINLVSLLFDFILDDDNLPSELAALITRLQIPIMRLAITDQNLFRSKNHPARLLLNDMASLGIGIENFDSKTFKLLQNMVQRLVDDFSGDIELFAEEHKKLLNIKAKLQQKITDQEKSIAKDEQAKDNRVLAYKSVDLFIEEKLAEIPHPLIFHRLLHKAWREILCDVYLDDGDESDAWQKEVDFFEQIIWSTLAESSQENKRQLLRVLPKLIQGCETAFDSHGLDGILKSHFLDQLREIHLKIINGSDGQSLNDQALSHTDKIEKIITNLEEPSLEVPEEAPAAIKAIAEDRIAAKEAEAPEPVIEERRIDTHAAFQMVEDLKTGTWFEYQYRSKSTRCKIAYYSVFQEKYTFVSQDGYRLFERDKAELVVDMQDGLCRILNDNEMFDRALESVIREIRSTEPAFG